MSPEKLESSRQNIIPHLRRSFKPSPVLAHSLKGPLEGTRKTVLFMIPVSQGEGYRVNNAYNEGCMVQSPGEEHTDFTCPLPVEPWVALLLLAMRCDYVYNTINQGNTQALELHILIGLKPHPIHMIDLRFESFKNVTDIATPSKSFIQNNLLLCPVAGSSEGHFYQATSETQEFPNHHQVVKDQGEPFFTVHTPSNFSVSNSCGQKCPPSV